MLKSLNEWAHVRIWVESFLPDQVPDWVIGQVSVVSSYLQKQVRSWELALPDKSLGRIRGRVRTILIWQDLRKITLT